MTYYEVFTREGILVTQGTSRMIVEDFDLVGSDEDAIRDFIHEHDFVVEIYTVH